MGGMTMDAAKAERMAPLLKALAHPVRLRLLSLLRGGEANVSAMIERLSLPQAAVSSQLSILRRHGLVEVRRTGGFAWYRLNVPRLAEVLTCTEGNAAGENPTVSATEGP